MEAESYLFSSLRKAAFRTSVIFTQRVLHLTLIIRSNPMLKRKLETACHLAKCFCCKLFHSSTVLCKLRLYCYHTKIQM